MKLRYPIFGIIATLFSAIYPVVRLVGANHYGMPIPWLSYLILHPDLNPWRIMWYNVIIDIVFWTVLGYIVWRKING